LRHPIRRLISVKTNDHWVVSEFDAAGGSKTSRSIFTDLRRRYFQFRRLRVLRAM